MQLIPLKSERIESGIPLVPHLLKTLELNQVQLQSGDILIIASKVLAYSQGLLKEVATDDDFRQLVRQEADEVLNDDVLALTMKNGVLIPNAGIDRSNTPEGQAILWPDKPFEAARAIRKELIQLANLIDFGVLISDSHCQALRVGTTGIAIGWAGFEGVQDDRGKSDLYGRKMVYSQIAIADNLASAAILLMGETDASIPFVIVRQAPVEFTEKSFEKEDYFIAPSECLFQPLYKGKLGNSKN